MEIYVWETLNRKLDLLDAKMSQTLAVIDTVLAALSVIQKREEVMSQELDTLTVQVKANTDAEESAITLLNGLSAQIAALKTDPVALQALSDELKGSADKLAAAVVANTPAAPTP